MDSAIYDKNLFDADYSDNRDWNFYRYNLAKCIEKGKPGKFLDLGAGLCHFTECCARFNIPCVAAEGSVYGLSQARRRYPPLRLVCCDLQSKLPFVDESFTTIFCNQVIEHLPPEFAMHLLVEAFRVLKKGGVLFIYTPSKYNWAERRKEHHINLMTPKQLAKLLTQAGFFDLKRLNFPYPYLGNSRWGRLAMTGLFKLLAWDFLSSSANFVAKKRD